MPETIWACFSHYFPTKEPPTAASIIKQYKADTIVAKFAHVSLLLSICAMVIKRTKKYNEGVK